VTKLLHSATTSLDGSIAGSGGDMQWQLTEAGELDEVLMFAAPVLRSDGVRTFEHAGGNQVSLQSLDASGARTLWFEILRD
jgi:dihydrofolate reductase